MLKECKYIWKSKSLISGTFDAHPFLKYFISKLSLVIVNPQVGRRVALLFIAPVLLKVPILLIIEANQLF